MILPQWNEAYSLNHSLLDSQHKHLFDLAHKAYKMANRAVSRKEIKDVIEEFFHYMKTHFKDEEQYMEAINYPHLKEHKLAHRAIIRNMSKMVKSIHFANDLKEELFILAKEWLLTHILKEDMMIEEYRKKAVKAKRKRQIFIYACHCKNKEHKLTASMHNFIRNSTEHIYCKKCHQPIIFNRIQE